MTDYTTGKLDNGIKYIYIPNKNIYTFSLMIAVKVGSRDETDQDFGYSHLLEHMLFKGTKRRPDSRQISDELELLGCTYNATTSQCVTNYYIKAPTANLEKCMDLLFDMVFNSLVRANDLEMEKKVVIEEYNRMRDSPTASGLELLLREVFLNHPLGQSTIGDKESILNFNRDKVYEYYKKFYNPNNITVSLAGNTNNITDIQFKSLLNKYSGKQQNITSDYLNPLKTQELHPQTHPRLKIETRTSAQQCALLIGFPTMNRYDTKNICAMQILENILGQGLSSRLFIAIRVKAGLAYSIESDSLLYEDSGISLIATAIEKDSLLVNKHKDNPQVSSKDGGLCIILNVLEKLLKDGVTKDEVERSKINIVNKLSMAYEDTHTIALYYNEQIMMEHKNIMTIQHFIDCIKSVKLEDINRIAREYLSFDKMTICVVGNYKQKQVIEHLKKYFLK